MKPLVWGLGLLLLLNACAAPPVMDSPAPTPGVVSPVPAPEEDLFPRVFVHSSGAGAWSTMLYIEADGTFSGGTVDADFGYSREEFGGLDYANIEYHCDFTGTFSQPERVDDDTYSMRLESIVWERPAGEVFEEDGIVVVSCAPYGLEHADEVLIYLPGADLSQLPEEFTLWTGCGREGELSFYGLYNVEEQRGFKEF